jgi:triphosphoribosyl-dephospho-CoA synthetase
MERAMYEATNQVNTQKGVIFLMGLSLFACGILFEQGNQFNIESFRAIIRAICVDIVKHELIGFSGDRMSHGEVIFRKYGFCGARGEAETGFQTVFKHGLPALSGISNLNDESLIRSFLAIASVNDDTNIIYRSDPDRLVIFKQKCRVALENFNEQNYSALIEFCQINNISPGGSADLLAVTIFVWLVMKNDWLG